MLFDFPPAALAALKSLPKAQRKSLKGQLKSSPEAVARFLAKRGFEIEVRACGTCHGDDHATVRPTQMSEQEIQSRNEAGW